MTQRFVLHCLLCIFFAALGWWLYSQVELNNYAFINSITVASYWFWFLIFLLFSWLFYLFLRRRSTKSWLIAQFVAFIIALTATITLLVTSYTHEKQRKAEEEIILQEQGLEDFQQKKDSDNGIVE